MATLIEEAHARGKESMAEGMVRMRWPSRAGGQRRPSPTVPGLIVGVERLLADLDAGPFRRLQIDHRAPRC